MGLDVGRDRGRSLLLCVKILYLKRLCYIMTTTFQFLKGVQTMNCLLIQPMPDQSRMLSELDFIEHFSNDRSLEFLFISNRIRKDLWNNKNTALLAHVLHCINSVYKLFLELLDDDVSSLIINPGEYVKLLEKYRFYYNSPQPPEYYIQFSDDLQLYSSALIIEEQWKNISSSGDGLKSFIEIFDDIFTQCMNLHKDKFFHPLSETDNLCRAVKDVGCKKERFIPYPTKTQNRWNPPGTQFLYLSFSTREEAYTKDLSINEYVCLLELRASKGEIYSFCNFQANKPGNILDLSYNDMTLSDTRKIVDRHCNILVSDVVSDMLNDSSSVKHAKSQNKKKILKDIKKHMTMRPLQQEIIEEAYAKQYLIVVCSCIYKKVDETDEAKKALAYKSFQILCEYLKTKGVTGIIYPCTRTKEIVGKNLVLFDVNDANPMENTIREFFYK